jgi:hypothetical protein
MAILIAVLAGVAAGVGLLSLASPPTSHGGLTGTAGIASGMAGIVRLQSHRGPLDTADVLVCQARKFVEAAARSDHRAADRALRAAFRAADRWRRHCDHDPATDASALLREIDQDPMGIYWG